MTWVHQLGADWRAQYQGEPPWKQIGKFLKPLVDTLPFSQVQCEWRHFLARTPARFVSIPRFVATHGSYGPPSHSPIFTLYRTPDELDRIAGIPLPPDPAA